MVTKSNQLSQHNNKLDRKYLHQLLLLNITTLEQITLLNKTIIMNKKKFKIITKNPHPPLRKPSKLHHTYFVPPTAQTYAIHLATYI
jgi:hypothetical protein